MKPLASRPPVVVKGDPHTRNGLAVAAPAPDLETDAAEREHRKHAARARKKRHGVEHNDAAPVAAPALIGDSDIAELAHDHEPAAQGQILIAEVIPAEMAELTDQLRASWVAAQIAVRTTVQHAIRIGHCLREIKRRVGHGKFTRWLTDNCPEISTRTARAYMQLADAVDKRTLDATWRPTADLNLAAALKMLAKPRGKGISRKPRTSAKSGAMTGADDSPDDTHAREDDGCDDRNEQHDDRAARDLEDADRNDDEPGDRQTSQPDEAVDDQKWLASLPLWQSLSDTKIFEEEALLWRRLQPVIGHLMTHHQPSDEELTRARIGTRYKERYSYLLAGLTGVIPPQRWKVCAMCRGTGASGALRKECDWCKGAGFAITHRGDYDARSVRR